jgi:AP-1 complex subunit gamma-1
LNLNTGNLNVELQQRAVEYENLFGFDKIRQGVMERMPVPEIHEENRVLGESTPKKRKALRKPGQSKQTAQKDLLDILAVEDDTDSLKGDSVFKEKAKNAELLKDLFGSAPSANGATRPSETPRSNVSDIMGLFGTTGQGTGLQVVSPLPALQVGGGPVSALDDLFEQTPETTQQLQRTYGIICPRTLC